MYIAATAAENVHNMQNCTESVFCLCEPEAYKVGLYTEPKWPLFKLIFLTKHE